MGNLNNKNLFLVVWRLESPRARHLSDENLLPGSQKAVFSLCPHMAEGARELSGISFIRALIPFIRAPSSLLKASPPNTITLGFSISTYEFWRDTNIQSITACL